MHTIKTPAYASPDGTYLDVLAPQDDAPEGAVLLNVSGCIFGLYSGFAISLAVLLRRQAVGQVAKTRLDPAEFGMRFEVEITAAGAKFLLFKKGNPTHWVTVPAEHVSDIATAIELQAGR